MNMTKTINIKFRRRNSKNIKEKNNNVIVKAENYKFYKEFYCLGIKEIE